MLAKAAPPPQPRIIYDRLGQVVREPTGPPPIILAEEDGEADEDGESSAPEEDEDAAHMVANEEGPLPYEMEPEYRHVSSAMSNAICEVLRRNGNRRAEFHVLSIPPAAWKTTEGFVLQALPLSASARRHPNILRCSDGPRFEPPRFGVETSEMTDAELAEDEEMAALRAELEDETAASMRNPRGTLMTSGTTSTSQTRARRQPWPSRYAPNGPYTSKDLGSWIKCRVLPGRISNSVLQHAPWAETTHPLP